MTEQEQTDVGFFELSDEEKALLPLEQLVCLALIRHEELHGESHTNSELTGILATEIGLDIHGLGEDDEKAKEARRNLAEAIRDARTHRLVDFERTDGGLRPSVTDIGQAMVEGSIRSIRETTSGGAS